MMMVPPTPLLLVFLTAFLGAVEVDPLREPLVHSGDQPAAEPLPVVAGQIGFGKRVLVDTWGIITAPGDWGGREWSLGGLAVGGTFVTGLLLDRPLQDASQESQNQDTQRWSGLWGQLGTLYSLGALGAAGIYGAAANDDRGVTAMIDGAESTIIASLIFSPVLKYVTGRARPNQTAQDADVFDPFSGQASFPSGHTTQAFTVATVLACTFDEQPLVGGTAYVLAAGVGASRVYGNNHYASDVVAGAILGSWVGYEVVHSNRRRRGAEARSAHGITDAKLDLIIDDQRKGVSLTWRW